MTTPAHTLDDENEIITRDAQRPVRQAVISAFEMQNPYARTPSITDIARSSAPKVKSPAEAIQLLMEGNARFFSGDTPSRSLSAQERRMQIMSQTPFAVILGCSDSRVPVEIVFDQGPGDLFVVRVAGNVVEEGVLGTVEFAVRHLNVAAIVVLGHEGCGAVQAALQPPERGATETPHLYHLLQQIAPSVAGLPTIRDEKARMREAVVANVRHQLGKLRENQVVSGAEKLGKVALVGAFYEISSGAVDFLDPN